MPLIAKLSRLFYDRFSEALVNELVELLNQVDMNSRLELQLLNEQNFARFDTKVIQAVAELEVRLMDRMSSFEVTVRKELHGQTRFMYLAWAVQLAAIVGLYVR